MHYNNIVSKTQLYLFVLVGLILTSVKGPPLKTSYQSSHLSYISISCFLDLPVPLVVISSEGSTIAGENYTLICSVSVIEGLVDDATLAISWTNEEQNTVPSTLIEVSSTNQTITLDFTPLLSSHGRRYICNASITIPAISTVKRSSETTGITVRSNVLILF